MKNAGRMRIETGAKWAAGKKTKERKKEKERGREKCIRIFAGVHFTAFFTPLRSVQV